MMSLGRTEEARSLLNELLVADPSAPHPYAGLARLALRAGELDIARAMSDEAARRIDPADAGEYSVLLSVAATLLALPGQLQRAENLIAKAATQPVRDPAPSLLMAGIKRFQEDHSGQLAYLEAARARWAGPEDELLREAETYNQAVRDALIYAEDQASRAVAGGTLQDGSVRKPDEERRGDK